MVTMPHDDSALFHIASDRRALVVGGAQGFGRGVVDRLVRNGVAVAVADIDRQHLDSLHNEPALRQVRLYELDVRDGSAVRHTVDLVNAELGGLDTLVNAAGVFTFRDSRRFPKKSGTS